MAPKRKKNVLDFIVGSFAKLCGSTSETTIPRLAYIQCCNPFTHNICTMVHIINNLFGAFCQFDVYCFCIDITADLCGQRGLSHAALRRIEVSRVRNNMKLYKSIYVYVIIRKKCPKSGFINTVYAFYIYNICFRKLFFLIMYTKPYTTPILGIFVSGKRELYFM